MWVQTFLGNNYGVIGERIALVLAFECGKEEKEKFTFGEELKDRGWQNKNVDVFCEIVIHCSLPLL